MKFRAPPVLRKRSRSQTRSCVPKPGQRRQGAPASHIRQQCKAMRFRRPLPPSTWFRITRPGFGSPDLVSDHSTWFRITQPGFETASRIFYHLQLFSTTRDVDNHFLRFNAVSLILENSVSSILDWPPFVFPCRSPKSSR